MDDRVAIFRRLIARYWQPLVSLGAAVPAVLNVLKLAQDSGVGISVDHLPGVAATPQQTYLRIAIFASFSSFFAFHASPFGSPA